MEHRSGEISLGIKVLLIGIAAIAVLIMLLTMQESLIGSGTGALDSFVSDVTGL